MKNFFVLFKKAKFIFILSFLLLLYTSICAFSYAESISTDISDSVFRLHVLANSNSEEDQSLKYKVRDNLISYMNNLCSNCSSKEDAMNIVYEHQNEFKKIATDTIHENGYNYNVKINIGNFKFPTKNYGDISLPAGYYDALRVEIGEAKGQNWWCVMFPSLCFVDISNGIVPDESKQNLKEVLSDEEYSIISVKNDQNNQIKFKFKLLEFFINNNLITAKNK